MSARATDDDFSSLAAENGRLRAVNADMLAALREIVRIRDEELRGTSGTRLANIARAAIAKAEAV